LSGTRLPPQFPDEDFQHRLLFSSVPGVRAESVASAAATLDGYVANYIEEEVWREADFGPFLVFLRLAAMESGQVVNLAGLA